MTSGVDVYIELTSEQLQKKKKKKKKRKPDKESEMGQISLLESMTNLSRAGEKLFFFQFLLHDFRTFYDSPAGNLALLEET